MPLVEHVDIRRELAGRLSSLLRTPKLPVELRPYQFEALKRTGAWLREPDGTARGYIEHATGLGKTTIFSAFIAAALGLRVLVIVPSKTLIDQTVRMLHPFVRGMLGHLATIGNITNDSREVISTPGHRWKSVVVTTDESFQRRAAEIVQDYGPHLVILDECHLAYTGIMEEALARFSDAIILCFSATPNYLTATVRPSYEQVRLESGQTLFAPPSRLARNVFGTLIDRRTVRWGIEHGWLAPLAWGPVDVSLSLDGLPVGETETGTDYQPVALQGLLTLSWSKMTETFVRMFLDNQYNIRDKQIFAVCPTVAAAEEIAQAIGRLRVSTATVSGRTPTHERRVILRRYHDRGIQFLSSVAVLREGWDEPCAEVCLMFRPTKSAVLYMQPVGRALRPQPDKVALVLDGHFTKTHFKPLTAPVLFGKVGSVARPGDIIVGPKARAATSPYLDGAPQGQIEIMPIELERWADSRGVILTGGEWWGTEHALVEELRLFSLIVRRFLVHEELRAVHGKNANGQATVFFSFTDAARKAKVELPEQYRSRTRERGEECVATSRPEVEHVEDRVREERASQQQVAVQRKPPRTVTQEYRKPPKRAPRRERGAHSLNHVLKSAGTVLASIKSGKFGDDTDKRLRAFARVVARINRLAR